MIKNSVLKSSETSTWLRARIEGVQIPQIEALNRLRDHGVPEELIDSAIVATDQKTYDAAEEAIVSWGKEVWGLSDEDVLKILNGEAQV